MTTDSIEVSGLIPASPKVIYEAWLDSQAHSYFTGSKATVEARIGGKHTTWNGEAFGEILELDPGKRIVESWVSTDFPEGSEASRVEVLLEDRAGGSTEIIFVHSNLPEGFGPLYESNWLDRYLMPMRIYFGALAASAAKAAASKAPKPAAGKAAREAAPAKPPLGAGKTPAKGRAPSRASSKAGPAKAASPKPSKGADKPTKKPSAEVASAKKAAPTRPPSRKPSTGKHSKTR